MATDMNQLAARAQAIERTISSLADRKASGTQFATALQQYRDLCELILYADFEYASANGIETQLWNAHITANTAFRSQLKSARRDAKERPVEFRKLKKDYLGFIKTSQRFYRQHILKLDAQSGGIQELRKVAEKWKEDASKIASLKRIPTSLRAKVFQSCHQTLIQLGDLSRYRAMELDDKERNWGPAKGYYDLAAEIDPDNGQSYNQLAVMAREDNDYFRLIYYLYRSLACKTPHPHAKKNLELGFKKILAAWSKGESISPKSQDANMAGGALVLWFCRLHSRCYKGEEFTLHDELESEVLSKLAIDLKERPLDPILQKIILTNIAAEYFTTVQMQVSSSLDNVVQTYFFFLRLNVKTFFTLLQILQPELERLSEGEDVTQNGDRTPQLSDKVTAVARRVLPGLRLYSTWFTAYWHILDAKIAEANTLSPVEVQELWKAYAATLTLLASSFPVGELPTDEYLLEEDVETIGFQPLVSRTTKRWFNEDGLKRKVTDKERSHPNIEMLMRVRDLLIDGLELTQDEKVPLDLDGFRFIYREAGLPSELLASPNNRADGSPVLPAEPMEIPLFPQEGPAEESHKTPSVAAASESASTTVAKDAVMNRMVDDLLGPDDGLDPLPEEDENMPPTPPEQTFEDTAKITSTTYGLGSITISDLVSSVQNYKPTATSPALGTPLAAMPMNRVASSSSFRQPAALPSLPDGRNNGSSIWNRNGPASPLLGHELMAHGSPMNGTMAHSPGHARGDSENSNDWNGLPIAGTPAHRLSSGLGSGAAWGNPSSSPHGPVYGNNNLNVNGYNQYPQATYTDINMGSPSLFGKYSSWNPDLGQSSYYRTPPNGQGG
ncbi:hypothetical protein BU24DRAFT_88956 [Aaosphaeria arxii CBS 175.79]|uniref:Protein SMG7 n=1 Tax=Aaosphaeria arxii CBS 175.79 TaxID=1450172 RepID=A0A6A5X7S7_9PLEO|nr:uncharacterized protein BU24DRAFT_88956 [Aaosphaeria arxii CBS 175.79]KAF2008971.1 hypothetical protein BU24DRAFT_88956 [Aaosphaeria arxii CBS 175.79]